MGKEQNPGLLGKYKEFNRLTRNIALGVSVVAAVVGASALAAVAFGAAAIDQGQIMAIDKWNKWRERGKNKPQGKVREKVVFQAA